MDRHILVYIIMAAVLVGISIMFLIYGVIGVLWGIAAVVLGYNLDNIWKWWKGKHEPKA